MIQVVFASPEDKDKIKDKMFYAKRDDNNVWLIKF